MSTACLPIFDETLHLTNSRLKELMERLHKDDRKLEHFYDVILSEMHGYPEPDPARLSAAVFDLPAAHISVEEVEKVARSLPRDVRDLWSISF
ncbi:hypothetical protein [Azospirillum sp. sgz302134]